MDWQAEVVSRADAWGIDADVERLRVNLLRINVLADGVRWRFRDDNVAKLLAQLKDAKYDAEDVIDDFHYQGVV